MKTIIIALRTSIVALVLTGLAYPLIMTGVAQLLFPWRAKGSLVTDEQGRVVGSELIAQRFSNPAYFQPRPSTAGDKGYDAASSSGSNLGPTSKKLRDRIRNDVKRLKEENPDAAELVPVELVTVSASGLDPDLSPTAMLWQVPRVAEARGVSTDRVKAVVDANVEDRTFGILGEPRLNVLMVNLALDRQFGRPASAPTKERQRPVGEN
jgi:potassium-transporting ATPase KdpC subunit